MGSSIRQSISRGSTQAGRGRAQTMPIHAGDPLEAGEFSQKFAPVEGEPFDPREAHRAGVRVQDAVDSHPGYTDLAKRIFNKQYAIAAFSDRKKTPWRGTVFMTVVTLGKLLGKSPSSVKRALKQLRVEKSGPKAETGILAVCRLNRQKSNEYRFIWRSWMAESTDGSRMTPQNGGLKDQARTFRTRAHGLEDGPQNDREEAEVNPREDCEGSRQRGLTDQKCMPEGSTLIPLLKDEPNVNTASISSSSLNELSNLIGGKYDDDILRQIFEASRHVANDVTPSEVAAAIDCKIQERRGRGQEPGGGLLKVAVPKMFSGLNGFQYRYRAKQEADLKAQQEAAAQWARLETELEEYALQARKEPTPVAPTIAPETPTPEICLRCGSDGIVNEVYPHIWCDCPRGQRKRLEMPTYVDVLNRPIGVLRTGYEEASEDAANWGGPSAPRKQRNGTAPEEENIDREKNPNNPIDFNLAAIKRIK